MNHGFRACKRLHKEQRCCTKGHYETRQEANLILRSYLNRVLMSNMVVYQCYLHGVWHLGHDKYMGNEMIVAREDISYSLSTVGGE